MATVRPFTTTELARMQGTQESAMQDALVHLVYAPGATNENGMPSPTWVAEAVSGAPVERPCGVAPKRKGEGMGGTEVPLHDAILRLPLSFVFTNLDRFKVVKRFNAAITPVVYAVVGQPERGPSGYVLMVQVVTDGS